MSPFIIIIIIVIFIIFIQPGSVNQFSSDAVVCNFSSLVLMPKAKMLDEAKIQQRFCSLLLDSAASETMSSLPAQIKLQKAIRSLEGIPESIPGSETPEINRSSLSLWQVKMVISASSSNLCPSVPTHFIESLKSFVSHRIRGE